MTDIIPDELMDPAKVNEVIAFLKRLSVPPRLLKETFVAWGKAVNLKLTRSMFEQLLGSDIDRV